MVDDPLRTTVLNHYTRFWGKPLRMTVFSDDSVPNAVRPLVVYEFSILEDGLTIYATVGMSKATISNIDSDTSHRFEVYIASLQSHHRLCEMLATVAAYPHRNNTVLGVQHTLSIGDPIIPGSSLTAVLLTRPLLEPPDFEMIGTPDLHIQILWAIPLHASERKFVSEQGWHALQDAFAERHIAVADLLRDRAT